MPSPSVLPRPLVHRVATIAVLAFCAWLAVRGAMKGLRPRGNDFRIYYDSASALLDGRDPLLVEGSIYPPSFDAALAPFALLPFTAALILWQSLSFACLLWGWRRCLQMLGPALQARPWVSWLALLAVARLVDSSFAYSQVNTITFALVAEAVHRWRQARVVSPALAIGAGAALKILPAGFVLWLLLRGAWRAAAASLIAILVWMSALALIAMGPERSLRSYQHWIALVVEPVGAGGEKLLEARDYVPGQSLTAACYRVFSATPATSAGASGPRANLFDFPLATTHRIVQGLALLHVAIWAATVLRRRRPALASEDPGFLLEAGLSVAMILALGPVVQKAHMLWLLLPYVALLGLQSRLVGWRRVLREALVWASILLIGATAPALLGDALATRLITGNVVFLGLECTLAALVLELWAPREINPSQS
ncbi:MAG TPA: glycosyltransferase family 87 protein [Planctomycetota bacterium]|nr:glycosyltransferase family 87 protein [Planctomycetota bacterium]